MGLILLPSPQRASRSPVETRVVPVLAVEPELAHAILPAGLPPFFRGDGTQLCCACLNSKIPPPSRLREACCAGAAPATSAGQGGMALVSRCLPNGHVGSTQLRAAIKPFPSGRFPTGTGSRDCQGWTTQI